jgi:glycerol kinase
VTAPRDTLALALDLGTTRVKAARLDESGSLVALTCAPAPPLRGAGVLREGDPQAYLRVARALLEQVAADLPRGTPLGVASQRSSFTVWDRAGRPVAPLVSWQDRRAAGWCEEHRARESEIVRRTGLPLSAHYAGPKLAALQRARPDLAAALHDGRCRFGTLDSFSTWHLSGGAAHRTDLTMAARTLMVDLEREDWSPELLALYDVPAAALPSIGPSAGMEVALDAGPRLSASLADQAAAALAVLDGPSSALVSLGTGTFVLRATGDERPARPGYLTGPLFGRPGIRTRYALEGAINGSGPALDELGPPAGVPPLAADPAPEAFAIPDRSGLGSPHWRPDLGLAFSPAAAGLDRAGRRRIVLEGLLFRVREILDDMFGAGPPATRVLLAGGLALDPALAPGLADVLDRPVEVLLAPETAGLAAAARLAAGLDPYTAPRTRVVTPGHNPWLRHKFGEWLRWLAGRLDLPPCAGPARP